MLNLKFAEVKRFLRAAEVHLDAARGLLARCPANASSSRGHDVIYLCGYVVECSLKALLLRQFPQRKHPAIVAWFKAVVRHDLERLRLELSKKGVAFPAAQREFLKHPVQPGTPRCDTRASPGVMQKSEKC